MPDPQAPEDDTHAATQQQDTSTQANGLEATEVDPYATVLPTEYPASVQGEPVQQTVEDTYATRMSGNETEAGSGASGSGATQFWQSPGVASAAGTVAQSRYRPVRLHARGGLGEIFLAIDGELNREVALKEIQERHGGQTESQFRFIFEAEVTGGLEHPGIVPVYGLGRYPDGRPYYAMQFIRGESLKAAIKALPRCDRRTVNPPRPAHSLEFRQLLARFVAVCHALDYAHSRGVIHRDIKPENIMLGAHGETLVVDWGLAKALNRPDPDDQTALKPLRPLSGSDASMTMVGSVMGTPAFMSPEQAAGEIDGLGPASDIFSLGSTLYALMTGKPPFQADSFEDLLEKVKKADFPPPRSHSRSIPPALEAICLKAMARRPEDRYPTAAAFAADIERWMADEPVSAYHEPWTARLARWARRHRTAVAAAFALLLTASTALAISTVLIGREQARTERNYQRARSAVEQMLTRVGEVDLADVPQMEAVRRDLLDAGTGVLPRIPRRARRRPLGPPRDRPGLRPAGRYPRDARQVCPGRGRLPPGPPPPGRPEPRRRVAPGPGQGPHGPGHPAQEEQPLRRVGDLPPPWPSPSARPSPPSIPTTSTTPAPWRAPVYQLGTLLARLKNRSAEDEATYRQAIKEQEALVAKPASGTEAKRELARYLNNLGILLSGSDPDAAEATFRRALSIQDEVQGESATNAGFRWQRARTWNNLANLLFRARHPEEATPFYEQARTGFAVARGRLPEGARLSPRTGHPAQQPGRAGRSLAVGESEAGRTLPQGPRGPAGTGRRVRRDPRPQAEALDHRASPR